MYLMHPVKRSTYRRKNFIIPFYLFKAWFKCPFFYRYGLAGVIEILGMASKVDEIISSNKVELKKQQLYLHCFNPPCLRLQMSSTFSFRASRQASNLGTPPGLPLSEYASRYLLCAFPV